MTSSIPASTPEQQARQAKIQQMTPDMIAEHAAPALSTAWQPLVRSGDVFSLTIRFDGRWTPAWGLGRQFRCGTYAGQQHSQHFSPAEIS